MLVTIHYREAEMAALTDRQQRVLDYLARCEHATTATMRQVIGQHGMTQTLLALKTRGLVKMTPNTMPFRSGNPRWDITEQGRERASA